MTDLLAYDSTRPALIPDSAMVVLYYGDGRYAWTGDDLKRFPAARRRAITVLGDPACNVADVENGDMRPGDVPNHLREWRHDHPGGEPGTVYCNRSTLPTVQAVCEKASIGPGDWNLWLATLDGSKPRTVEGGGRLVAVQYQGGLDADYDVSLVLDRSWPRRAR
jgi:hypothetical protein